MQDDVPTAHGPHAAKKPAIRRRPLSGQRTAASPNFAALRRTRVDRLVQVFRANAPYEIVDCKNLSMGWLHDDTAPFLVKLHRIIKCNFRIVEKGRGNAYRGAIAPFFYTDSHIIT